MDNRDVLSFRAGKGANISARIALQTVLVFILSGKLAIRLDGCQDFCVPAGNLFLIPVGKVYAAEVLEDETSVIVIPIRIQTHLCDCCSLSSLVPFKKEEYSFTMHKIPDGLWSFVDLLRQFSTLGLLCPSLVQARQKELLHIIAESYSKDELAALVYPLMDDGLHFREMVIKHYAKARTVKELAQLMDFSESGFIRKFKTVFNCPPYEWMLSRTNEQILSDITLNQLSGKELAEKYNFTSEDSFLRHCKRHLNAYSEYKSVSE